jgi:hypothetical protein
MHFHLTRSLKITDIKVYLGEDHANNDNGGGGWSNSSIYFSIAVQTMRKNYFSSQIQYNKYIRQFVASDSKIYM